MHTGRWIDTLLLPLGVLVACGCCGSAFSQAELRTDAAAQYASLKTAVREARNRHQGAAYLDSARALHRFLNGSPNATVELLAAELAAGHSAQALESLKDLARMGQSYDELLQSEPFGALRNLPEYPAVANAVSANAQPRSTAERLFELPPELVPEDIDYDKDGARFFITSVLKHEVLVVTLAGASRIFAQSPEGWPMMALKIDPRRKHLWVTEVDVGGSRSAVLIYDLGSGRLRHRIAGPPQTDLGDMCLTPEGDAIVSDGGQGGVYRVHADTLRMERIDAGDFVSPQTPAMAGNGRQVWIPDYARGIGLLDLKSKKVSWLTTKDTYALSGVDGLYLSGHHFIVTQNGTSPERVVRFTLNDAMTEITAEFLIERATPTLGDPTHGVVAGDYFYYLANSGWDALDQRAHRKPNQAMTAPLLMRASLAP
jgi:hypothetical protein